LSFAVHTRPFLRIARWLVLALGAATGGSAAEDWPAIFAPRAKEQAPPAGGPASQPGTAAVPAARAPVSDKTRAAMNGRLAELAAALPKESGDGTGGATAPAAATVSAEGATVMSRFVVRSVGPSQREVEGGNLLLRPLREFERIETIERNAESYAASLLRFRNGSELELRVTRRTGGGADHGRETPRVEIGLRVPW